MGTNGPVSASFEACTSGGGGDVPLAREVRDVKRIAVLFSTLALSAAMVVGLAGSATAGTAAKTTGSIGMDGTVQYAEFNAFQTDPVKGSISYTNFDYVVPGTGVWLPSGTFDLDLMWQGSGPYVHTVTVDGYLPFSPTGVVFWGTGYYVPDPGWTETFSGTIEGSSFELTLIPDDGGAKYNWTSATLTGSIASDGTVSGSWSDTLGRTDAFTVSSGLHEVFHYVAPVNYVDVTYPSATFGYTIPEGIPLAGLYVTLTVIDGGSPGSGHDTFRVYDTPYDIVSGNLTVFAAG